MDLAQLEAFCARARTLNYPDDARVWVDDLAPHAEAALLWIMGDAEGAIASDQLKITRSDDDDD